MKNYLVEENSPYLLQHAHQAIHWQKWSDSVFTEASKHNKLVFLSIGYSTCHWCHVMSHESFDDLEVAEFLNRYFVSVKVDREEHLNVDATYMSYLQLTTGRGGWPMSLWLTPSGEAIFGGTYFPKDDKEGQVGFINLCRQIQGMWQEDENRILSGSSKVFKEMRSRTSEQAFSINRDSNKIKISEVVSLLLEQVEKSFDPENGGFGESPKFPRPVILECLLTVYKFSSNSVEKELLRKWITVTLDKMQAGGIFDQLDGGFHRYSVDAEWKVPHFEKMLYDQAQLIFVYSSAFKLLGYDADEVIQKTLSYIKSTLESKDGGYYAGEDADSENVYGQKLEGAYWTWGVEEIYEVIKSPRDAAIFSAYYGVEQEGNVEEYYDPHRELKGKNVLYHSQCVTQLMTQFDMQAEEINEVLRKSETLLIEKRKERVAPHKDKKVITAWNAYLLKMFVFLAKETSEQKYFKLAEELIETLYKNLWDGEVLYRSCVDGHRGVSAFAQDYLSLLEALLLYHRVDRQEKIARWINTLADACYSHFWDELREAFVVKLVISGEEVFSMVEDYDGAEPSSLALSLSVYSKLVTDFPKVIYTQVLNSLMNTAKNTVLKQPFHSPRVIKELIEIEALERGK